MKNDERASTTQIEDFHHCWRTTSRRRDKYSAMRNHRMLAHRKLMTSWSEKSMKTNSRPRHDFTKGESGRCTHEPTDRSPVLHSWPEKIEEAKRTRPSVLVARGKCQGALLHSSLVEKKVLRARLRVHDAHAGLMS